MSDPSERWWTSISLSSGEGRQWRIGPLELWTLYLDSEWQVAHERHDDEGPAGSGWSSLEIHELHEELSEIERFAAGAEADQLRLQPRVADRSVVAKPRMPFHILPGQTAKVYVSTPLWIEVRVGRSARTLVDLPTRRLSDTWFGPSTREGEVAYALKTHARVRLEEIPARAYRAITPVVFENDGSDVLPVDRMNLPVPYLALYANREGTLWTQAVTLTRREGADMAELDVKKGPPREAGQSERLSDAREKADANVVVRAFSSLLRTFGEESG